MCLCACVCACVHECVCVCLCKFADMREMGRSKGTEGEMAGRETEG